MRTSLRPAATAAFAGVWLLAGCAGTGVPSLALPGGVSAIPMCEDVPRIAADEAMYRDRPIYVSNEMPVEEVRAWAAAKPGFEEIWIDRDHNGWLTLAFSSGAAERQAELPAAFPGVGVVAVAVPWTMAELEALQRRVVTDGEPFVTGSGIDVMHGVVTMFVGVLKPDVIAHIEARFAGEAVCLEGIDPADAAPEGPQPTGGTAWRLLADEDRVGGPYRTGIATDAALLAALWQEVGLASPLPSVDFASEIVVWFGAVHGSSCPRLRLDDVRYDAERGVLHSVVTRLDVGGCTADAIGHAYLVAVDRSLLPAGPFRIQLQADDPPGGVLDTEPTIVDADLSIPRSTLGAGQILKPTPGTDVGPRVELGGVIEPDYPWQFRLDLACGAKWLGTLNGVAWKAVPDGEPEVPDAWAAAEADGTIDLTITLTIEPEPRIEAVAAGTTRTYVATTEALPSCP